MSLHDALAGMRSLNQWFVWRLEWNATEAKYNKTPCALDGSVYRIDAGLPASWQSYSLAAQTVTALNATPACSDRSLQYALGFWLTADCGYFLFDIDKCTQDDGSLTPFAASMVAAFPGCLVEWSSSRKGVHVIGRMVPGLAHRSRDVHKMHMELYHQDRGIAFGLDGMASGSADTECEAALRALVEAYFPPRAAGERSDGPRADWRGPADDDALIERMLAAKAGASSVFGGKASVGALWRGEVEPSSEADMALARHLAFWTGCDEERIERLMRRSGLRRAKWDEHRTYLRELTIPNACAGVEQVYQEPVRSTAMVGELYGAVPSTVMQAGATQNITPEVRARVEELLASVAGCGTFDEMHNEVIPAIVAARVPSVYSERFVRAVNAKLDLFDSKLPVAKLRALLFPPILQMVDGEAVPAWVQQHCYVKDGDFFYDVSNGARMTWQGFIAEYARLMPLKPSGARENPAEWALTRWGMRTVHHLGYRPDRGVYFEWDGMEYANLYAPSSVPQYATEYSERGLAGIAALQALLWDMCGRRDEVYSRVVGWLAHNVQRPGVKIRWSPLIKGTQGDGKSLIANALRAAMGYRNVGVTGNATLTAQGGFNDWMVGSAVNFLEEIHLTGKDRYRFYNVMKECITNDVININAKGGRTYKTWNITNHCAFSNHNDAIPLERDDRRWMIVFTPWFDLAGMWAYCGLDAQAWRARTDAIDWLWREGASELRSWLLTLPIDGLDITGSALETPERMKMMASSQDDAESVAQSIIMEGAYGVTPRVVSSVLLGHALKLKAASEGFEVPRSTALNHMMTRLGYSKVAKQIKWKGITHTVWVRNGFTDDNDAIRLELDTTSNHLQPNLQPH
jgi:hypothetical protein